MNWLQSFFSPFIGSSETITIQKSETYEKCKKRIENSNVIVYTKGDMARHGRSHCYETICDLKCRGFRGNYIVYFEGVKVPVSESEARELYYLISNKYEEAAIKSQEDLRQRTLSKL